MDGAVNAVGRCAISRFTICNRAVCSVTIQRKISSPYATGVTDERICDGFVVEYGVFRTTGSAPGAFTTPNIVAASQMIARDHLALTQAPCLPGRLSQRLLAFGSNHVNAAILLASSLFTSGCPVLHCDISLCFQGVARSFVKTHGRGVPQFPQ